HDQESLLLFRRVSIPSLGGRIWTPPRRQQRNDDHGGEDDRMQSYIRPVLKRARFWPSWVSALRGPIAVQRPRRVRHVTGLARCRSDRSRHDQESLLLFRRVSIPSLGGRVCKWRAEVALGSPDRPNDSREFVG